MSSYSIINNYIFKEDIGEGNFGKVKLAIHKETGEEFAIKILNKKQIKIKMKNTIFKENEIISKFNHINVIFVFAIIEDIENYYIVMEYCKTGELFDYIVANQFLSEEESSVFFYQLINGVEYIHSKGIAHRDLKPENLLLTENNILKIIDFGLSHEFDKINFLSTKCGSPSYAAPEIIKGGKYDGFKTDIWCCGIILYAMVCGYLPFDGEDNNILFKNIVECNPEIPDYLSPECRELIMDILKEDPMERINIDDIKKTKFYLKGKQLCNINYEQIERSVLKRRHRIRSYDRGEQNNDNIIKMIKKEEKKKEVYNLIEESLKEFDINKSERSSKIRNVEQKRHIRFINTKTALNNFRDKINLINKNFNKKIKKFHKNMNLILNTDANVIVNKKINNDPLFYNQIISLTKNTNNSNITNTVNSTINYAKSASNSKNKDHKNLSSKKKYNKMPWRIFKDNKSMEKNKQKKKYELIYNNLSHNSEKNTIKQIEVNKNNKTKSIYTNNNITNSINIINNINNTINNYGTLNIFTNKTQIQTNKIYPEIRKKNEIKNIKKINTNSHNKNNKSLNLNIIKKNIVSTNSSKSAKKEINKNQKKSISKNKNDDKKRKSTSLTINSHTENRNQNIYLNNKKTKNNNKQYPSLKIENKLLLKQNYINRIINNINYIKANKKCISISDKDANRKNLFYKINGIHSMSKSSRKLKQGEKRKISNDKFRNRNKKELRINNLSPIQKEINIETTIKKNKVKNSNSNSISINKRNNNSKSKATTIVNSRSKSSKSGKDKNKRNNNNQNNIKKRTDNKIYKTNRHSENKSNRYILYTKIINDINNIRNNSKSINNIKSDYARQKNNKVSNKPNKKTRKMNSNQINIKIIKNLNNLIYQDIKDFFRLNIKKPNI